MRIKEHISYAPLGRDTRFQQRADIDCCGLPHDGLLASAAHRIEEWSVGRYHEDAAHGRNGFAYVLSQLYGGAREPLVEHAGSAM